MIMQDAILLYLSNRKLVDFNLADIIVYHIIFYGQRWGRLASVYAVTNFQREIKSCSGLDVSFLNIMVCCTDLLMQEICQ